MPINDLGYRNWPGRFTGPGLRWLAITQSGISIALKSQWIRRMLFISFLPVVYIGTAFFFFEKFKNLICVCILINIYGLFYKIPQIKICFCIRREKIF